jgi:putative transposase
MSQSTTFCPGVSPMWSEVRQLLRRKMLEAIELLLDEELSAGLGCGPYERTSGRRGYRNGSEARRVTTEVGPVELEVPRGRIWERGGFTVEFQSQILPRYARRSRQVDEAVLGAYLAGVNTRRIRRALEPLLGEAHLSKSAVSRVVGRLKRLFETWDTRDLSQESYLILYLDALNLKVRLARRVVSVPVLAVLGVAEGGQKHLVALRLAVRESGTSWGDLVLDLQKRGLQGALLLVSDGHPGLAKALEYWPKAKVQRSTVHKLRNLLKHCPPYAWSELKRDYHQIVYAKDGLRAREAYKAFLTKWSRLCPPVARSLEEAGLRLLTFYESPKAMWKSLRSTNTLENLNREFRRRTKTHASFSTEQAAVTLLYGLIAFGQIRLRRIDGHRHVRSLARMLLCQAA